MRRLPDIDATLERMPAFHADAPETTPATWAVLAVIVAALAWACWTATAAMLAAPVDAPILLMEAR